MRFALSPSLTAFAEATIGTKVMDKEEFMAVLEKAVEAHDPAKDRAPGQHYVVLPAEANVLVAAGVGRRQPHAEAYVHRVHRGRVTSFLERQYAASPEKVAAVVYTRAAYLADPDVIREERGDRVDPEATHVLVAVLAFAGPNAPLSPYRFVKNLAGGNNEALVWGADEIRAKASESAAYWDEWEVVAD